MIEALGRAWALVGERERKRLQLVAVYGVVIAGLDTFALLLVYALINLFNDQSVTGVSGWVVRVCGLTGHDRYRAAFELLGLTAVLFVVRSLLSVVGFWLTAGAANEAEAGVIGRLLVGHAHAPQIMRTERSSAETLRTVLTSVDQVTFGIVASSVSLLSNLAVTVAVAVALLLSSPLVAAVIIIYFAFIAFVWIRGVRGALARRGLQIQELVKERLALVLQAIAAAKELQLRGRALVYAEGAIARTRSINAATRVSVVAGASLNNILQTWLVGGAVVVVAMAGFTGGRTSVFPALGLVMAGAFRLLPALNQVLFLSNQVQLNRPAIDVVERELQTYGAFSALDRTGEPVVVPLKLRDALRVDRVTFQYPTRTEPALREVSFTINAGEAFGIVGPTGSGKSTLLDILLGQLEVQSGEITVDGQPLSECRNAWQRSIGYVPQDVYLVDDSLRANVALGWYGEEVDDERVAEAIQLAGLAEVVASLPDGVETLVGERGVRLSGGQRQRVGLARALYVRPSVLVLDEATSNLDRATEHRIVETLGALRGGVTMMMVTHRLASIRHCDRILYLENGSVRAFGLLEEVIASVPDLDEPGTVRVGSV